MRPPSGRFMIDKIVVYAPGVDVDSQSAPRVNDPGDAGSPIACSVQITTSGEVTERRDGDAPVGVTRYTILVNSDPAVAEADQFLAWVEHDGVAKTPPVIMRSNGAAVAPHGTQARYTVSAASVG